MTPRPPSSPDQTPRASLPTRVLAVIAAAGLLTLVAMGYHFGSESYRLREHLACGGDEARHLRDSVDAARSRYSTASSGDAEAAFAQLRAAEDRYFEHRRRARCSP